MRIRHSRILLHLTLAGILAGLACDVALAAAPYRGRPVEQVLDELARAANLQLVYTSAVVPPATVVAIEPTPGPPQEAIVQVLAPLGLQLQRIEGRIYSVVPQREPPAPASAPATAPAAPAPEPIANI